MCKVVDSIDVRVDEEMTQKEKSQTNEDLEERIIENEERNNKRKKKTKNKKN
jgi:hypothetical protein